MSGGGPPAGPPIPVFIIKLTLVNRKSGIQLRKSGFLNLKSGNRTCRRHRECDRRWFRAGTFFEAVLSNDCGGAEHVEATRVTDAHRNTVHTQPVPAPDHSGVESEEKISGFQGQLKWHKTKHGFDPRKIQTSGRFCSNPAVSRATGARNIAGISKFVVFGFYTTVRRSRYRSSTNQQDGITRTLRLSSVGKGQH